MAYLIFARWFGVVSIILSFGILFNLEDAREMAKHMVKSETAISWEAFSPSFLAAYL